MKRLTGINSHPGVANLHHLLHQAQLVTKLVVAALFAASEKAVQGPTALEAYHLLAVAQPGHRGVDPCLEAVGTDPGVGVVY